MSMQYILYKIAQQNIARQHLLLKLQEPQVYYTHTLFK